MQSQNISMILKNGNFCYLHSRNIFSKLSKTVNTFSKKKLKISVRKTLTCTNFQKFYHIAPFSAKLSGARAGITAEFHRAISARHQAY